MTDKKNKTGILELLSRAGLDGFILALLAMILLAWLWPHGGTGEGPFSLSELANYGVSAVFFLYGLRLSKEKLKAGLGNWRLHLVVQLSTFLLFPLIILAVKPFFTNTSAELLWMGTFFLASLPSTVSSSVVMVSIAEGNIPAAIFNASISSIMGVFITPLWMQLAMPQGEGNVDLGHIITKLVLQVLVPVLAGILLHRFWGAWAEKHKKNLKYFDQTIILIIVYTAFCESFEQHMFSSLGVAQLVVLGIAMVVLFFLAYYVIMLISKLLSFNRQDKITAIFCGSKKSLVHGTVMSKVLFSAGAPTGLLLLPLMIYHALQLIIASMIARRFAQQGHESTYPGVPQAAVTK